MGGGGGSFGSDWSARELAREIREAEKDTQDEGFKTDLGNFLGELLARFNSRDENLVRSRLDKVIESLEGVLADKIDQLFGGSVAKRTYIDGLSDIDCLLIVDKADLQQSSPKSILNDLVRTLSDKLKNGEEISSGNMAVTVRYADGMEIQLLPAARDGKGLRIPSSQGEDKWSTVDPRSFNKGLTKYNIECNNKLVPTIKLAKAILSQLPDAQKLSGYHVESLAIDAFKNYSGTKTTAAMLPHFFERAKERVLSPMTDSSRQSVHVDGYMGSRDSSDRKNASHILDRISKRIANASASGSLAQWKEIFGNDE